MKEVKISIIVPVYNAAKQWKNNKTTLHRCIDSILKQEYKDFELILVNDGSKDESKNIIDEYAKIDERIVVIHKENTGVSNTRNIAIDIAKGKYIQFLDADDWITSDASKTFIRAIEENNCDLVIADFYRVIDDNVSHKGHISTNSVIDRETFADYMIQSPSDFYYGALWNKLYRRDIIQKNKIRMNENLQWAEDFIFNLEYIINTKRIIAVPLPLYYYVKTEGSIVMQGLNIKKIAEMKMSVIRYYDEFYRNIYDEEQYQKRKLEILSFLINFAKDESAFSVLPSTKKLGEEIVAVASLEKYSEDMIVDNYVESKLLEGYLRRIATSYDLSMNEIRVLHYIFISNNARVDKDIALFTGLSQIIILSTVEMLILKGFIENKNKDNFIKNLGLINQEFIATKKSESIFKDIRQAFLDINELIFEQISKEEIEIYKKVRKKSIEYMKKQLN